MRRVDAEARSQDPRVKKVIVSLVAAHDLVLIAAADGAVREDGFLGVSLDERTDGGQGAIVVDVEPDTPADEAGIRAGDIVIDVDGTPINGSAGLVAAIRDRQPGDEQTPRENRVDRQPRPDVRGRDCRTWHCHHLSAERKG